MGSPLPMNTRRLSRFSSDFHGLGTALEKHVHALDHKALVVVLHRNYALHSKDVCCEILRDLPNPGNEPLRIERAVGGKGQTADLLIEQPCASVSLTALIWRRHSSKRYNITY